MAILTVSDLSFAYATATEPLFTGLDFACPSGWTGVVGANGSGKSTLLRLLTGDLRPTGGTIRGPSPRRYCDQRTEEPPPGFDDFLNSWDETAIDLIRALAIEYEWLYRWDSLSFGERKRAQLGTAMWQAPEVLAVDEPTNHLDGECRRLLTDALNRWDTIGIIVSHDRTLLDRLCDRCLFLSAGGPVMRPGGVSRGLAEEQRERLAVERQREQARREEKRLRREAQRRNESESRSPGALSKRGMAKRDHDAKSRVDLARFTGKDRHAGEAAREMRARARTAVEKRRALRPPTPALAGDPDAIVIDATPVAADTVVSIAPRVLRTGEGFSLEVPELVLGPQSRIGIVGPNGSGKSTVVEFLAARMAGAGRDAVHLRQELTAAELTGALDGLRELQGAERGRVVATIAQLGTDPERLLTTAVPSPGEARKIILALAARRAPSVMLLDEPTNHLDLPSVLALESALARYPGCLVVVSHDERFLEAVTDERWALARVSGAEGGWRLAR